MLKYFCIKKITSIIPLQRTAQKQPLSRLLEHVRRKLFLNESIFIVIIIYAHPAFAKSWSSALTRPAILVILNNLETEHKHFTFTYDFIQKSYLLTFVFMVNSVTPVRLSLSISASPSLTLHDSTCIFLH